MTDDTCYTLTAIATNGAYWSTQVIGSLADAKARLAKRRTEVSSWDKPVAMATISAHDRIVSVLQFGADSLTDL